MLEFWSRSLLMPIIAWRTGDSAKCEALWVEAGSIEDTTRKHMAHFRQGKASGSVFALIQQSLRQKELKLKGPQKW